MKFKDLFHLGMIALLLISLVPQQGVARLTLNGPGDSSDDPIDIVLGIFEGFLSDTDDSTWWRVALLINTTYLISLYGDEGSDFDLFLYDSNVLLKASSQNPKYPENIQYPVDNSGDYLIEVESYRGSGGYTLEIEDSSTVNGDLFLSVNTTLGFDIYEARNFAGKTIILDLEMTGGQHFVAIIDTQFTLSVQYALLFNVNDQINPHLLADSFLTDGNSELDNIQLIYTSALETIYVVVYSTDILYNDNAVDNLSYRLISNEDLHKTSIDTDYESFYPYFYSSTFMVDGDEVWDSTEWTILMNFDLLTTQVLDLLVVNSGGDIGLILFSGDSIGEINTAIQAINDAISEEVPLPSTIYNFAFSEEVGYMTYSPQIDLTANLAVFANGPSEANINYTIFSTILFTVATQDQSVSESGVSFSMVLFGIFALAIYACRMRKYQ